MKVFKKDVKAWKKEISKYDSKAGKIYKRIKTTFKKKEFSDQETKKLIDFLGKSQPSSNFTI